MPALAPSKRPATGGSLGARGRAEDVAVGADSVVGSLRPEWVVVRGRGLGADAVAREDGEGVSSGGHRQDLRDVTSTCGHYS